MSILSYLDDGERWHEQGHVMGYGVLTIILSIPSIWFYPWVYVAPGIVLIASVFIELVIEGWIENWEARHLSRFDLLYDLLTKGLYGPLLGFIIARRLDCWWEFVAVGLLAMLIPYKFKFFGRRES